jgi:hypothetical protein
MSWLIVEVSESDAARDAKSAKTEFRLEERERDADWTTPPAAWLSADVSDNDAVRDAKSAKTEARLEERDKDEDRTMPPMA